MFKSNDNDIKSLAQIPIDYTQVNSIIADTAGAPPSNSLTGRNPGDFGSSSGFVCSQKTRNLSTHGLAALVTAQAELFLKCSFWCPLTQPLPGRALGERSTGALLSMSAPIQVDHGPTGKPVSPCDLGVLPERLSVCLLIREALL